MLAPGAFFYPAVVRETAAAALACSVSCKNPFRLRDPEPPVTVRSSWIQPLRPELVLENMQNAVHERNADNFVRCLASQEYGERIFRFDPDPKVAQDYPGLFMAWDRDRELAVIRQAFAIVPADSAAVLVWTEDVREFTAVDSAVTVKQYRLEFPHTRSDLPRVFEGHVEFRLAEDTRGEWAIYRWIDNALAESHSWSLLKASLGG